MTPAEFAAIRSNPKRKAMFLAGYLRMVEIVARKTIPTPPPGLETGDLIAYGHVGLLEALETFKPEKGFAFSTHATFRIRGAIVDGVRAWTHYHRMSKEAQDAAVLRLDDVIPGTRIPFVETLIDDREPVAERVTAELDIYRAMASLNDRERDAIAKRFGDGLGLAAIGQSWGTSESWASRVVLDAIGKLRIAMSVR